MGGPAITLRCECGADGRAAYGERWTCPECGRSYDPGRIPADEYQAVRDLDRRYRLVGFGMVAVLALMLLLAALTQQLIAIVAGLGVVLTLWFVFLKPLLHARHRRAVGTVSRNWNL